MTELITFIEQLNQDAAVSAKKMEELIYQDPSSSIVKARVFAEEILKRVFELENLSLPPQSSLNDKIIFLSNGGYITSEVQNGFHTIRMTGNKAAHTANYDDLSEAIMLHKIVYKIAVWFYEIYTTLQLTVPSYEYPKPPAKASEELQDFKKEVFQLLANIQSGKGDQSERTVTQPVVTGDEGLFKADLSERESYLMRELRRLKDSSKEAIENANAFSKYKEYLHVERKVQLDLEKSLTKNEILQKPSLILLCGSVGDGKSHLLAYLKENKPQLLQDYQVFNDATESFSPTKDAMETLREVLEDFSDQKIGSSDKKVILAINLGVLHNFINLQHESVTFNRLKGFISNSGLFSQKIITWFSEEFFDLISFSDYRSYELTERGAESKFFSEILSRVFAEKSFNPFFLAYKEDLNNSNQTMVHENYRFLQNAFVQKQIVQLTIEAIIRNKIVISARAFLNFIADLIIPDIQTPVRFIDQFERLEQSVPTLLFKRRERSFILKAMYELDPLHSRSSFTDQLIIDLNTLSDWSNVTNDFISDQTAQLWIMPFRNDSDGSLSGESFVQFSETIIRLSFLTNEKYARQIKSQVFNNYLRRLYDFNHGRTAGIRSFYDEFKDVIQKWKGTPLKDYVYLSKQTETIRIAQKLNLKPNVSHLQFVQEEVLETFKPTLSLAYNIGKDEPIPIEVDFALYELLQQVLRGYCPNKKDEEDAINFVEFVDKMMNYGEKSKELIVHYPNDGRFYKLYKDDFGSFVFEKE
ncbi:DNA phosphorothioation-dependent restriction protein DptF [Paenibacillus sp. Soil766]|nr:DNA phosphorothioation-dependent restriction protein DptF [Paenibacillus sp. Soil766]